MSLINRESAIKIAEKYSISKGTIIGKHSGIEEIISDEIKSLPSVPAVQLEPLCQWLAGYAAPPNYALDEVRDDSIDPESLVYTANDRAKAWEFHFQQLLKSGLMDTEGEDEQKESDH